MGGRSVLLRINKKSVNMLRLLAKSDNNKYLLSVNNNLVICGIAKILSAGKDQYDNFVVVDNKYLRLKKGHLSRFKLLFHGSQNVVDAPSIGGGSNTSDYGSGFYLTPSKLLAGEWAVTRKKYDGYINRYALLYDDLNILDLRTIKVESWISILLENRGSRFSEIDRSAALDYAKSHRINYKNRDIIIGWRADDSYFTFIKDFIRERISVKQLEYAVKLGGLGYQWCIKTNKAMSRLIYLGYEIATKEKYESSGLRRDITARELYTKIRVRAYGK
jgi:hypothetical protein